MSDDPVGEIQKVQGEALATGPLRGVMTTAAARKFAAYGTTAHVTAVIEFAEKHGLSVAFEGAFGSRGGRVGVCDGAGRSVFVEPGGPWPTVATEKEPGEALRDEVLFGEGGPFRSTSAFAPREEWPPEEWSRIAPTLRSRWATAAVRFVAWVRERDGVVLDGGPGAALREAMSAQGIDLDEGSVDLRCVARAEAALLGPLRERVVVLTAERDQARACADQAVASALGSAEKERAACRKLDEALARTRALVAGADPAGDRMAAWRALCELEAFLDGHRAITPP